MTTLLPALAGAALVAGALALWFRGIRAVALEGRRPLAWALIAAGAALAVAALLLGPGLAGGAIAVATLLAAGVWAVLGALAPQSRQVPAVAVGLEAPDFTAPDDHGGRLRLADLRGHPVLLKLFRGHW